MARKIQIKHLRSGKIKNLDIRYAEVLVKLKKAVFIDNNAYVKNETVVPETTIEEITTADTSEVVVPETTIEEVIPTEEKKKRGRRKKEEEVTTKSE